MFRKITLVLLLIVPVITAAGCWDGQDISDRSILLVGGLDLSEKEQSQFGKPDKYDSTILLPNLDPKAPSKVRIEEVSGASVSGTRDPRAYKDPKSIVTGMVKVEIVGEKLAVKGLKPLLDSVDRSPQVSSSLLIAVAEGLAKKIVKTQPKNYGDLGAYLGDLLKNANNKAFIPVTNLHEFIQLSSTKGRNPVLPLLKVENEEVVISGSGIFNKDRLIAKITTDDTRSLVLLRGLKSTGYIPFVLAKDGIIVDRGTILVNNSRKVKVGRKGDDFTFEIDISLTGTLIEHESEKRFTENDEMLKMIQDQVATDIKKECNEFVRKMQKKFKVDCIDISHYALAKWRNELQDEVDKGFIEKANIKVDVKVELENTGELS